MKFIQKAVEQTKEPVSLIALLHERLGGYRKGRGFTNIHASALMSDTQFCPREVALIDLLKIKPKDQYIPPALQVTFDQGESLHNLARNKWLKDLAVGSWSCPHCGYKIKFSKFPKVSCKVCGDKNWQYTEEVFVSQTCKASGSIDILLDVAQPKLMVTEVKTMDKDEFKKLVAPLAEHRLRTNFYMWLIQDSDDPNRHNINPEMAKVLYISKAFGTKNGDSGITPFKEFDVKYEPDCLKPYIERASIVKNFRELGIMPERICPTSFVPRVKQCACPKDCWGNQFMPGIKVTA